jgi:outer membrane protein TolC
MNLREGQNPWQIRILPADEPVFEEKVIDYEKSLKTALEKRPDFLEARIDLANRDLSYKLAKNQLLPSLDFIGTLGVNGLSGQKRPSAFATPTEPFDRGDNPLGESWEMALQRVGTGNYYSWLIGLQLEIPLGNRGARSDFTKKLLSQEQGELRLRDLKKEISGELAQAMTKVKTNLQRIKATKAASALARKKLEAEEKKYEVGMSTTHDVLDFQEDLAIAEANELRALIDYIKSVIELEKSQGTLLETSNVELKKDEQKKI